MGAFCPDFELFWKLWTAVYPSKMAPISAKLWEHVFQMIPDISFFDAGKKKSTKIFVKKKLLPPPTLKIGKLPVLEELWIFGRQWQMRLENSLPKLSVSAFYDPWRRGKKGSFCFWSDFGQKKLAPSSDDIRRYISLQKWGPTEHWRDPTEH